MKKINVGVIGVGYLGKFHAEKYAGIETAELVGISDINRDSAEAVARKFNVPAYSDYRQLFNKVDAVSIVVPTPLHYTIAKEFLQHNVDVLIEKPMTTTLQEADELIAIAETRGRILQVGHLERYNPAVVASKDIIREPMFIEADRLGIYNERGTDVSVVLDLMIHDIDIISSLVKSDIKLLHAAGMPVISKHVDIANARVEFESGCIANVTASRISTKNERKIRLFQKNAYLSVDFTNHVITIIEKGGTEGHSLIPGMKTRTLCFNKGDALEEELKAFVQSVADRSVPLVSGQVGRNALKIALTVMDQIKETYNRFEERHSHGA